MAAKLFLDEQNLRDSGVSAQNIITIRKLTEFVDNQAALASAQDDINANAVSITDLAANDVALDSRLDGVQNDIVNLQTADVLTENRIDAYDALAPFVRQDQAAAPAFTPYAGQTVSLVYVQAEAQATDDAAKANSIAIAVIITALQAANVLT